jgi:enoyl-[acyl-carrier-protein] reductase (NADH)
MFDCYPESPIAIGSISGSASKVITFAGEINSMKELEDLAEQVRSQLNLDYDTKSIKFIEEFIERQKNNFDSEQRQGLINSLGSFVGQCIIKNYGGYWQVDNDTQTVCIAFDDKNKIFPFAKTARQFENGLEDSVYSFYKYIPSVFKHVLQPTIKKKKWWKFW